MQRMLTSLVFELCLKENTAYNFRFLMSEIFKYRNGNYGFGNETTVEDVIKTYLFMISLVKVKEVNMQGVEKILIELDKPDYLILPEKE